MDTGHIRSGSRAVIARRIRSAIRWFELGWIGLDTCRTLAGCRREWPLSRGEPGDGMATRRFSRADGKESARPRGSTLAANGRPSAGDVRGDPSLLSADRPCPMAATAPDRRQPPGHRVRHLPVRQLAPSAGAGADTTDATWGLVLCRGDRAWRGTDAGTDLSWSLSRRRPQQGPRGSRRPHQCQSRHGGPGLRRPLCRDDRSRRVLGVAGLSLPGSHVRVADLVQSGCDLGPQPYIGGCSLAYDQPGKPALSAFTVIATPRRTIDSPRPPLPPGPNVTSRSSVDRQLNPVAACYK